MFKILSRDLPNKPIGTVFSHVFPIKLSETNSKHFRLMSIDQFLLFVVSSVFQQTADNKESQQLRSQGKSGVVALAALQENPQAPGRASINFGVPKGCCLSGNNWKL